MKLKQKNGHQNHNLEESFKFLTDETDKMVKANFMIRRSKLTRFKSVAVTNSISMTKLLNEWIDEYLEEQAKL